MFNVTFVFEPNANTAAFEEALCKFCDQLRVRATCSWPLGTHARTGHRHVRGFVGILGRGGAARRGAARGVRACTRLCSGVTLGRGSADLWQTLEIEREWLSRRLSRLAPTEAPGSRSTSGSTLGSASAGPSEEHETRPDYDAPPMPAHVRDGALAELLTAVHGSLVRQGKCSVSLGCADAINLKLFAALPQPPPVHLHEVSCPLSRVRTHGTPPLAPLYVGTRAVSGSKRVWRRGRRLLPIGRSAPLGRPRAVAVYTRAWVAGEGWVRHTSGDRSRFCCARMSSSRKRPRNGT